MQDVKRTYLFLLFLTLTFCTQTQETTETPALAEAQENSGETANQEREAVEPSLKEPEVEGETSAETLAGPETPQAEEMEDEKPETTPRSSSQDKKEALPSQEEKKEKTPPLPDKNEGKPQTKETKENPEQSPLANHQAWNQLLKKYVSAQGLVNYRGLQADKESLAAYLQELATHPVQDNWSRDEKMAYWINAYNAYTVKLIVDYYPIGSITSLHNGKPWDVPWIKLGDKTYSLNQIENSILRPVYQDARIHFAVNCAARSCPPLLNQAYTAQNLQFLLESQAKKFINNAQYNALGQDEVKVSKIFEWYASDFGSSLPAYLNHYAQTKIAEGASIHYQEYDWSLNE